MIKLQVIGNLGRDAVVNNVNGKTVINFSVAHTEKYKDANGVYVDRTTWVECAYWTDKTAIVPYLLKGQSVFAEGSPVVESYTSKEGKPGVALRLRVQQIQLVGGKLQHSDGQTAYATNSQPMQQQAPVAAMPTSMETSTQDDSSDLPF